MNVSVENSGTESRIFKKFCDKSKNNLLSRNTTKNAEFYEDVFCIKIRAILTLGLRGL